MLIEILCSYCSEYWAVQKASPFCSAAPISWTEQLCFPLILRQMPQSFWVNLENTCGYKCTSLACPEPDTCLFFFFMHCRQTCPALGHPLIALFLLSAFAEHDSDSDSELSLDEHSSSYASSHSSDSEEDGLEPEKKWNTSTAKNNERGPLHSTPKGTPDARGEQRFYFLQNSFKVDVTNLPG